VVSRNSPSRIVAPDERLDSVVDATDRYQNWSVVAGYFDGDGSVEEVVGQFVVMIRLGFKDNWDRQLFAVRSFLDTSGIRSGKLTKNFHKGSISAWQLRVTSLLGVVETSKQMLPYAYKKRTELKAVIDYLEDRITGDELVEIVNNEVRIGNKTGKTKKSNLPFSKSEGDILRHLYSLEKAHDALRVRVSDQEVAKIREDYYQKRLRMREISELYGYGKSVIERILEKRYRTGK